MSKSARYLFGIIFGFAGFIFLTIIGALLKLQPMFVHGAKNPETIANACFKAGALYGVCVVVCYVLWKREKMHAGELGFITETFVRRNSYYEIEDSDEELPLAQHMSPMERYTPSSPPLATAQSV
uniref:Uncharacterized protein n=1 Tax=Globisporangium ultimum (strain ATCC 200006 / CBS 805.95 / DAOM BR144) TaxID=431595 RepID=K3WU30_GLOUD